ncbi:curli production assembly protein CsgG [Empedobacter falsenii]|uniref:Curli production assembly protein CsgG n=1 Tax=Empedobacter falsenii TaxID=343874 RepID=A0ABY8V839_9FLAO|nr:MULTISPECIES: CsgG/HfaB family protein [Empedobacter]MDM1522020.1 curli production assembly protein CsgG [Empedobacter sp. 225-1]WIH97534.1 curli production assembly protein CsgG [Empedobacter falsenii]
MYKLICNRRTIHFSLAFLIILFLSSCHALLNAPTEKENSTLGEVTPYTKKLKSLPNPREKVVVAVYKFKDQTGQYKPSEFNANWSTAIPQGTTSILLKALEDSKWFTTIERENISDLLNERQIIKSTRQEYAAYQAEEDKKTTNQVLPPLLFAGIILEGGIVSYDSNVMTGGAGARYFGVGGNTEYRQDRISVYLRAVSTNNGKILKTVYTSKTILSQSVSGGFFRYVDVERLLEAEIGITKNEPVHLAVKEAIEKAVYDLIIQGAKDDLWKVEQNKKTEFEEIVASAAVEDSINNFRVDNRILKPRRGTFAIFGNFTGNSIQGDYRNSEIKPGLTVGAKYFFTKNINFGASFTKSSLKNSAIFYEKFTIVDLNLEYIFLPEDNLSPFVYGGVGMITPEKINKDPKGKANVGAGFEYMPIPSLGIRAFGEYDFGFNDDWDNYVGGNRKDNKIVFGGGLSFYFGRKKQ